MDCRAGVASYVTRPVPGTRRAGLRPIPVRSGKPLIVNNECATGLPDTVVFYISLCECDEFLTILN
jgi:hypothetical protein